MKKMVSLLLVLTMLLSAMPACSSAEDGIQPYASYYFDGYGTTLNRCGSGRIKIVFSAIGNEICDQIGVATYQVQRLEDDGDWVDVSGLLNGSTGRNMVSYTFGRYFYGVPGETYRVKVTFICTKGGSSETKSHTSGRIRA